MLRQLLCGMAIAGLAMSATAVPIDYDEAVSGDLGMGLVTVLTADLGSNVIKGSMVWNAQADGSGGLVWTADLDPFEVHLPQGMGISQASVVLQFVPLNANTNFAELSFHLLDVQASTQRATCFQLLGTGSCPNVLPSGGPLFDGYPLTSPSYIITQSGGLDGANSLQDFGGTINYAVTLTVQAVPEPGTAAMMLAGVLGLAAWRRQRR